MKNERSFAARLIPYPLGTKTDYGIIRAIKWQDGERLYLLEDAGVVTLLSEDMIKPVQEAP